MQRAAHRAVRLGKPIVGRASDADGKRDRKITDFSDMEGCNGSLEFAPIFHADSECWPRQIHLRRHPGFLTTNNGEVMKVRHFAVAALACFPMLASAADVVFVNQSSWEIHEIYFSPAKQKSWGEDHLEDEVLQKGDSLTLTGVTRGKWDVRVVDEDGDQCVLEDVRIDGADKWVITDKELLACQAAS